MLIGKPPDIPSSEITSKDAYRQYLNRRRFLRGAAAAGITALAADRVGQVFEPRTAVRAATKLQTVPSPLTTTGEQLTSLEDITHYNNFYEFGVDKGDPAKNAGGLPTRPWTVKVEGKVKKPLTFDIDALLKLRPLEDRVYRHRCVEAWSMVIPWVGYSLSEFIKQCDPLPSANYVQFLSYYDRHVEKWGGESTIDWPYSEGLRMDEAMNPLTLLTFGLYGDVLPNQDGAPVRVVIPWKYGFKSAKSIVTVRFVEKMPGTT
jgi:sulfoxide reductase catalytic subunit YedY